MSDWLMRLLGVDASAVPEGAATEFVFTNAPQSWRVFLMLVLVVGLLWAVWFMYRRESVQVRRPLRLFMAGLRCLVLLLIVLTLMGPALSYSTQRRIEPYVLVLVDDSMSISIQDRYPDEAQAEQVARLMGLEGPNQLRAAPPTRAELINQLLSREDAKLLESLTDKGRVRVMSFSRDVRLRQTLPSRRDREEGQAEGDDAAGDGDGAGAPMVVGTGDTGEGEAGDDEGDDGLADGGEGGLATGDPVPPIKPSGQATNLARALREARRSVGGSPIAAVVVITDGRNTEGDDPLSAIELLKQDEAPVFTIGIGDDAAPRNLKVAELWAPESVFREDPFIIESKIDADGVDPRSVTAELIMREVQPDGSVGGEQVVGRQTVNVPTREPIQFEHRPDKAGDYVFAVRVPQLENEMLPGDNEKSVPVRVLSNQARVLMIAGSPTWDFRLASQLLIRDKTTDVSTWLQSMSEDMEQSGNTKIRQLPRTRKDLFEYDVIILMDPNPEAFDETWVKLLKDFVSDPNHAGGVMWVAGPKYTARFLRSSEVRELLPVEIGELSVLDIERLIMVHEDPWPLEITPAGLEHAMLRLEQDPEVNRQLWSQMPGIFWSFPAERSKPAARTLLSHTNPQHRTRYGPRPLLVAGRYGRGRTVYMGFTGSWRWRRASEQIFDRYWVQGVRYLVEGRLQSGEKRGRISTDRDVYPIGARVRVSATLSDPNFEPLTEEAVEAKLRAPGGETRTFEMRSVPNEQGQPVGEYEGSIIVTDVGLNEVVVTLGGAGEGPARVAKQVTVEVPRVEFADPRLDPVMLRDLADRTGGRMLPVDEAVNVASFVPERTETIVIRGKPVDLWDTSRLLIIIVVLLTIEWALRKRTRMM